MIIMMLIVKKNSTIIWVLHNAYWVQSGGLSSFHISTHLFFKTTLRRIYKVISSRIIIKSNLKDDETET